MNIFCIFVVLYLKNKTNGKATAKQIIITTGETQGDVIEVLSGLNNNDEIITDKVIKRNWFILKYNMPNMDNDDILYG